jgi:hypothetical protein
VRPKSLSFENQYTLNEEGRRYLDKDLVRLLGSYPTRNFVVFASLSPGARYRIARLQAASDETPLLLKKACQAMLEEHAKAGSV